LGFSHIYRRRNDFWPALQSFTGRYRNDKEIGHPALPSSREGYRAAPIGALKDFLFEPLSITRIRVAMSRVDMQLPDEARYRITTQGS